MRNLPNRHQQMHAFATVAHTGSLAAAARELNVSTATLMRTVAALEARLGATLLLRSPRGVSLSAVGEQFAERCQLILAQTAEAERSSSGLHSDAVGRLTVSMPLLMTHQVFMPLAVDYLDAFPDMQLLTQARETLPKLLDDGIDVALVVGHLPDSTGFAVQVGEVRPIICAAPAYLAQWGVPGNADVLKNHRTLVASATAQGNEWRLPVEGGTRSVRTAPVLTCSTQQGAIQAAVCGLGLIRCLRYEAHHELQNGLLEPVLHAFPAPPLPVHLTYREGRKANGRVRSFVDFIAPRLRAHPAFRP